VALPWESPSVSFRPSAGGMNLKKFAVAGALVGVLALAGGASASDPIFVEPTGGQGCVSHPGDTCTYTSTRTGGYVANGSTWSLTVSIPTTAGDPRDVNLDGQLTYTFGPGNAPPQGCSLYPAGSTVTTSGGSSGGIAAGNPFLQQTDSTVANACAGGPLPDRTDATPQ
jgi:hypothetical protein